VLKLDLRGTKRDGGLILRYLGDQGILFYSLEALKTVHGRLAAMVQLGRSSTVVGAPSAGAPALRIALVVVVRAGAHPPSNESA
jgi:hypothetical protein